MRIIQVLYQLPCKVEGIHDYDSPEAASQEIFDTGTEVQQYLKNLAKNFQIADEAGWVYARYNSGVIFLIPRNQGKEAIDKVLTTMGIVWENSEVYPVHNVAEGGKSTKIAIQQPFSEKIVCPVKLSVDAQIDKHILEDTAKDCFEGFTEAAKILGILGANGWGWTVEPDSLIFTPPEGIASITEVKEALKKQGLNPKDFYIYRRGRQ